MHQWTFYCFNSLIILNITAMNMKIQISLRDNSFIPLYIYPEVGLLDHMVVLFLISWGTAILFSVVAIPVYIATNSIQVLSFLHILASVIVFLITAILTGVAWLWFFFFFSWFAFSWWLVMLRVFSCTCWPFICLLWEKMFNQIFFICHCFFAELYELLIYFGY